MMTDKRVNAFNKTPPKSILKSSQSRHNHLLTPPPPVFFSGNESSSILRNFIDTDHSYMDTTATKLSYLTPKMTSETQKEKARFQISSITSRIKKKSQTRRRTVSDMYILHSTEVNKQIIKLLLKSTDNFLEEFRLKVGFERLDDRSLMLMHREKLIEGLRKFLHSHETDSYYEKIIGVEYDIKDQQFHNNEIGIGLSEPNMLEMQTLRGVNYNENLIHAKSTASIAKSCLNEPAIYGSLPTKSYMDQFTKELESHLPTEPKPYSEIKAFSKQNVISKASASKKIVRFADTFGLDLEKVKIITNNSFSDFFSCPEYAESCENNDNNDQPQISSNKPFLLLLPLFSLPKRTTTDTHLNNIKLDNYVFDYENNMIRCMVKVRNLSFQKNVFARISLNRWASSYDLRAVYVKSESEKVRSEVDGTYQNCSFDLFGFCLIIPEKSKNVAAVSDSTVRIEFALCYEGANHECYWDNNSGQNYIFQCFFDR